MPNLTLSEYVTLVGLNQQGGAYFGAHFGSASRSLSEWTQLFASLLASPDTAWLSGCLISSPTSAGPATPDDDISLPAGEGFLERHLGTVQMTPLLRDVAGGGEPIITRFVLDAPVVET